MEAASLLLPVVDFPHVIFAPPSSSARIATPSSSPRPRRRRALVALTSTRLFDCAEPSSFAAAGVRRCLEFIKDCFAFAVVFARPLTSRAASDVAQALVIPAHQLCKHRARLTHKY
ncbi:hypothetical protein BD626DRAFT_573552 [Schizophyllum amplum]|uniref:Uncharacterized protein n=1 Tax=Schizophyllum amplum TaxID=97359 RepID=A0A550C1D8_9AGAR|nr:hypothetical protein BD626DRAFT_573552 [Auriculariopsis ampla]